MGYTVTDNGSQYDRGVVAGEIAQRLRGHDEHLAKINGSMGDVARELSGVKMQLQRLADSMESDRQTVITTASALEKERAGTAAALATEKETAERKWSPVARLIAVIAAVAAVGGTIATIITLTHH